MEPKLERTLKTEINVHMFCLKKVSLGVIWFIFCVQDVDFIVCYLFAEQSSDGWPHGTCIQSTSRKYRKDPQRKCWSPLKIRRAHMPESLKHFAGKILTKLWLFFLFSKVSANFYRYLCEHSNAEQTKMILTIMTSLRGLKSA